MSKASAPLSDREAIRLVQHYVEQTDARRERSLMSDPPGSEEERREMLMNAEIDANMVRDRDDPRGDQVVYAAAKRVLAPAARTVDDEGLHYAAFAEWVRRGLLELDARHIARLRDEHGRGSRDQLFDPQSPAKVSFGEVAEDYLRYAGEEASANGVNQKSIDKKHALVALVRDIVGHTTPVAQVDFDACQRLRSTLARVPANREKIYPGLPLQRALIRAEQERRPTALLISRRQQLQG